MLARTVERVTPSAQRARLKAVEKNAQKLLLHLGIDTRKVASRALWDRMADRPSPERVFSLAQQNTCGRMVTNWLSLAGLSIGGKSEVTVNAELGEAAVGINDAIVALLFLHERAGMAVEIAKARTVGGRGAPGIVQARKAC